MRHMDQGIPKRGTCIMEFAVSSMLYLLGALFMTMHFQPEEGGPPFMFIIFVFAWPLMTIYFLFLEFFGKEEE